MCVTHFHVVGQLEPALEIAGGDALKQHFRFIFGRFWLASLHQKRIFLGFDLKIVFRKSGDSHRDAISVLSGTLYVVGRVRWGGLLRLAHIV